jgi:uncharacterized protein (TIGR00730 family)
MKKVVVFCGSGAGNSNVFKKEAYNLGLFLASNAIDLVYGGAQVGLMGAVADGVLTGGGKVTGVIPDFLAAKEIRHHHLTEMIVVKSMHERKLLMSELCDGVIALPGGFGTLDELFEMLTWAQLGLHQKPIALYNIDGYFNDLIHFVNAVNKNGFISDTHRSMLIVEDNAEQLLAKMNNYQAPPIPSWLNRSDV